MDEKKRPVTRSQRTDSRKVAFARDQRKNPTASERLAWQIVRRRGLLGLKFHRQQTIDGFVVDLYCAAIRACIEIDGAAHDDADRAAADVERSVALERRGIHVLRIRAEALCSEGLECLVAPLLGEAKSSARDERESPADQENEPPLSRSPAQRR